MESLEILRIMVPAIMVGVVAYIYNRATRGLYKQIGELEARIAVCELHARDTALDIKSRDLQIQEQDQTIQEQSMTALEQKENTRSLRSIVNRNEGRIGIYESNETSFQGELVNLRNKVLSEQAKQRFLEKENNELRHELFRLRNPTTTDLPPDLPPV